MKITIKVGGTAALSALVDRLDRAAAGLQQDLTGAVREGADPVVARVRAAWRTVEVSSTRGGGKSSGLRSRVAAATRARPISRGVRIEVDGPAVDPRYGRSLAWYLDGSGAWVHPVFGQDNVTATQRGQRVFEPAAEAGEAQWRARLERVVSETIREIEGAR